MDASLDGRTVLVTGANGGLGEEFVTQALARGAVKVYAATRTPRQWDDPRIQSLILDVTEAGQVSSAATVAHDVDLLINNAGIAPAGDSISGSEDEVRRIFETNFFGTLALANAFSPVLVAGGGGTMLNVLSAAAWMNIPTGYAASKAAMWSATSGLRTQLQGHGVQVIGLHVGMVDTPMSQAWDVPKVSAESVVRQAYDGVVAGAIEVLADEPTRDLKARLSSPADELYPWLDDMLASLMA